MRISLITPVPMRARNGNRNTAARWARFLRELGHRVRVEQRWSGVPADVMIALHARRSHESVRAYAERFPGRPLVVVLTGTDLYRDIRHDAHAQASLALASALVVLQDAGVRDVPPRYRAKTRIIYQSARPIARPRPLVSSFEVVVSGHLREEKDPFRAAAALALVPDASRLRVTHIGGALTPDMAEAARTWMRREPRYRWLGEVSHARALRILARSRLMVISSRMEGGANVVCEALACGVPVIASRIPGNVGMLGARYPGYYPTGDAAALARLLARAERDPDYYARLETACAERAALVRPARERAALKALLGGLRSAGSRPPARAAARSQPPPSPEYPGAASRGSPRSGTPALRASSDRASQK